MHYVMGDIHNEVKNLVIEISDVLDNLEYNLKSISIDKVLNEMGFPKNWKEIVDIERWNRWEKNF